MRDRWSILVPSTPGCHCRGGEAISILLPGHGWDVLWRVDEAAREPVSTRARLPTLAYVVVNGTVPTPPLLGLEPNADVWTSSVGSADN